MSTRQRKVLVLNKVWMPVAVVTLQRAVTLLFSEYKNGDPKARVIDPSNDFQTYSWDQWSVMTPADDDDTLVAAKATFRVPKVILLLRYDKTPQQRVHFSRRTIYRRDNHQCQYCSRQLSNEDLTIDHVVPRAQGGITSWDNCVLACVDCNAQKADRTPEKAFRPADPKKAATWRGPSPMKLIKIPTKPRYTLFKGDIRVKEWEHFLGERFWEVDVLGAPPTI